MAQATAFEWRQIRATDQYSGSASFGEQSKKVSIANWTIGICTTSPFQCIQGKSGKIQWGIKTLEKKLVIMLSLHVHCPWGVIQKHHHRGKTICLDWPVLFGVLWLFKFYSHNNNNKNTEIALFLFQLYF